MILVAPIKKQYIEPYLTYFPIEKRHEYIQDNSIRIYGVGDGTLVVGVAAVSVRGWQAELEYIFIHEDYRGIDIIYNLLTEIISDLHIQGVKSLNADIFEKRQRALSTALLKIGFLPEAESLEEEFFEFKIKDTDIVPKRVNTQNIVTLKDLSPKQVSQLGMLIKTKSDPLIPLPISKKEYSQSLSMIFIKDNKIRACEFIKKIDNGTYCIRFMASFGAEPQELMTLVWNMINQCLKTLNKECTIQINALHPSLQGVIKRITKIDGEKMRRFVFDIEDYYGDIIEEGI